MGFWNSENVVIENLTPKELENILGYIDDKNSSIFGISGRRYIQVDVRYSSFSGRMFFKLTIPKSWIEPTGLGTAIDMIRRGVL